MNPSGATEEKLPLALQGQDADACLKLSDLPTQAQRENRKNLWEEVAQSHLVRTLSSSRVVLEVTF